MRRYTGAEAREMLLAVEPGTPMLARSAALVVLRLAARDLAATVEALEAERDEARRSLARIYQTLGFDCDGNDPETGWWHLYDKAESAAREHRAEADAEGRRLDAGIGDLLAVIHRDGGHHQAAVGLDAALADARERVVGWLSLEANLAEARLCLLAEAGDPRGAEGLHPGWVHRAVGWCLVLERQRTPVAAVHRERPSVGEGACYIAWTRDLTRLRWTPINADLTADSPAATTMREAMRWVEREAGL